MNVPRWLRPGPITRAEAERLLDRTSSADDVRGLPELLAVAAAPPRPEELAGERAAVAGFRREFRAAAAEEERAGSRRPAPRRSRRVAVVAVSAVVALFGGTAYAAGTGILPTPVQQQLHETFAGMGVPPPDPRDPRGTPTPAGFRSPEPTPPPRAQLLALCRTWNDDRAEPGRPDLRPDDLRLLSDAAGGRNRIPEFCAALTGSSAPVAPGSGPPTADAPGPAGSAGKPGNPNPGTPPTHPPGQGNGNTGNKGGNGRGNGPPG